MGEAIKKIFNHQNSTLLGAASVLAAASLASRIAGLLRDRLLASTLGASDALDIYYGAFRLPDLVFNILVGGAVSAAFIPIFAQIFRKDKDEAWRYGTNIINFTLVAAALICFVLVIFAPSIMRFIVPGFADEKFQETVMLSRIMFLSPILLGISSLFSGILHYFERFFIYSLAPILYNIGIIVGITVFFPLWGLTGLALGVVLGALLHLVIQIPAAVSVGWRWRPVLKIREHSLWETLTIMIPRTFSMMSMQINLWVVTAIGSLLAAGSLGIFYLADNLQYLPVGVFGFPLAIALFPSLAKAEAAQDPDSFLKYFSRGFRIVFFLVLPASVIFFILRAQIVRVVLGAGNFGWVDTRLTAAALGLFALGIIAQALQPLLNRAFFSFGDTRTPTVCTVLFVILNIVLALFFIKVMTPDFWLVKFLRVDDLPDVRVLGLPLAFSLAGLAQIGALILFLKKKNHLDFRPMFQSAFKVLIACVLSMPVVYIALYGLAEFLPTDTFIGIFLQGIVAGLIGISLFLFLAMVIRCEEVSVLRSFIETKFKVRLPQIWSGEAERM